MIDNFRRYRAALMTDYLKRPADKVAPMSSKFNRDGIQRIESPLCPQNLIAMEHFWC